jgi:hypothetical protein
VRLLRDASLDHAAEADAVRCVLRQGVAVSNRMNALRVPLGSLAAKYYKAWREFRAVEDQLESLVESLYGSNRFEIGADGIDVYEAIASEATAAALWRAGFRSVRVHDHKKNKFLRCACAVALDPLGGSK